MRKARFTEHQIIAVLKSVEAGRTVKDVCREAGISEQLESQVWRHGTGIPYFAGYQTTPAGYSSPSHGPYVS